MVSATDLGSNDVRRPRYGWVAPGVEKQIGTDFQPHLFIETQTFLNANLGAPIGEARRSGQVLERASDEPVWAFCPDGQWEVLVGRAAIREFYESVLSGRKFEAVQKTLV